MISAIFSNSSRSQALEAKIHGQRALIRLPKEISSGQYKFHKMNRRILRL